MVTSSVAVGHGDRINLWHSRNDSLGWASFPLVCNAEEPRNNEVLYADFHKLVRCLQ